MQTMSSIMSTINSPTVQARGTTKRRQNRSCDQCRRSKRACDAAALYQAIGGQSSSSTEGRLSCSYCTKTKKNCTMVMADLHTRSARTVPRPSKSQASSSRRSSSTLEPSNSTQPYELGRPLPFDQSQDLSHWHLLDNLRDCGEEFGPLPLGDVEPDTTPWMPEGQVLAAGPVDNSSDENASRIQPYEDAGTRDFDEVSGFQSIISESLPEPSLSQAGQQSLPISEHRANSDTGASNYQKTPWSSTQCGLSPFSVDQKVSASFHRQMTSSNLLKIYHDVLEHHLSCWVSEMTCPYQERPETMSVTKVVPEWGTAWSNRVLQRTVRLDRVAQTCKLLHLTPNEQKAASNALNLAVMAFATQWAQGSLRSRRRYSATSHSGGVEDMMPKMMEDFDRTLQHYFWTQTQRALQEVVDIDCYQVACAEIIFSLAQRPWYSAHQTRSGNDTLSAHSIRSQVQHIIERDGPPVYSERAARRMHVLKYRCDNFRKGFGSKDKKISHGIASMSPQDRDTIGLLYWLSLMFDTVSASMYERPVVVMDEDCRYEVQRELSTFGEANRPYRWDYEIFMRKGFDMSHRTYWPCSYEAAAEDVTKSAPVKVLLFRHVSYLQNALRQSVPDHQIEDIIFNTILIYDYWNRTHGAFFKELVQNFSSVPQRIRGWFICISAHWHLAVLMLADLVEFVDENDLGLYGASCNRLATDTVNRFRRDSARELSDLAHIATLPTHLDMPPESPDFHHAVNEGTILTEPWTMILIKAFSKSCIFFLEKAEELRDARNTTSGFVCGFKQDLQDAENCIKVLWLLGKKSDMAGDLAEALQQALRTLRSGFVLHMM